MNVFTLEGKWDEGYALDNHTISSEYLGEDEYGRKQFSTNRSELGQLVYELKYKKQNEKAVEIRNKITPFLNSWDLKSKIHYIIPAPSSTPRNVQPVDLIADEISKVLEKAFLKDFLVKESSNPSKNLTFDEKEELSGTVKRNYYFTESVNVLLVDDLYQSGKTLDECVKVLREDKYIDKIYVLCMTKTKSR